MNSERLINVVLLELSIEKLKIEDGLERVFDSSDDITSKSYTIKELVARLVTVENTIEKFNSMILKNNESKKTD